MPSLDTLRRALADVMHGRTTPAGALAIDPETVRGLYRMGANCLTSGRESAAVGLFQRCVMLDPTSGDHWFALANAHQACGNLLEAAEFYQVAAVVGDNVRSFAYAAACFAHTGQAARARSLAAFVQTRCDDPALEPWLLAATDPTTLGTEVVS